MKTFLKIIKIVFSVLFSAYSVLIIYFLFFSPKEKRFNTAEHSQGLYISQTLFDILIFQNPNDSNNYFEKSVAFNKRGEYAEGFSLLNKAVEKNPKLHLGYRGYMKLRFLRDYKTALSDFNNLDSLTPNFVDAPWGEDIDFLRGECFFGLRDYSKAIEYFSLSIKNQKEDWADIQAFVYLGICNYELGNYEKAITEFKRALKQFNNSCEAHFWLAKTYYKTLDTNKAIEHIIKAEESFGYKRDDLYKEFINEVYFEEIEELKKIVLTKQKNNAKTKKT